MKKLVLFVMVLVVMVWVYPSPGQAAGDTSTVFVKAVAGPMATQHQGDEGEVGATFQIEGIRMVYWNVGMTFRYWDTGQRGENQKEYAGRAVIFGRNPNAAELYEEWVPFLTVGGVEFYDNQDEERNLAQMDFDGSIGVIGPLAGMKLVGELGGRRKEGETYWWLGLGFFFVPKL